MAQEVEVRFVSEDGKLVTGRLSKQIHRNIDNGYTVAVVRPIDTRNDDKIVVVGVIENPCWGEIYEFGGESQNHEQYGTRFQISWYRLRVPTSTDAIERYIQGGLSGIAVGVVVDPQLPVAVERLARQVQREGAAEIGRAAAGAVVQVVEAAVRRDQVDLEVAAVGVDDVERHRGVGRRPDGTARHR